MCRGVEKMLLGTGVRMGMFTSSTITITLERMLRCFEAVTTIKEIHTISTIKSSLSFKVYDLRKTLIRCMTRSTCFRVCAFLPEHRKAIGIFSVLM